MTVMTQHPIFRFLIGQYVTIHGDVVSHVNISRVRIEDGGQYACAVANRAGAVRHTARLNVYGKARMDGNVTHMYVVQFYGAVRPLSS